MKYENSTDKKRISGFFHNMKYSDFHILKRETLSFDRLMKILNRDFTAQILLYIYIQLNNYK